MKATDEYSEATKPGDDAQRVMVPCQVADTGYGPQPCVTSQPPDPCTLVIFGASGDLTARKLVPALFNLYRIGGLPVPFQIVDFARTVMDHEEFRARLERHLVLDGPSERSQWRDLAPLIHYHPVEYGDITSFVELSTYLKKLDEDNKTLGNRVFYLAIPPMSYETVARHLGEAGLAKEKQDSHGWSRIVVEKPFGRDLETAIALDRSLRECFEEHQIYRIDHYLAKETVQNILIFRFANSIFEPIWNRRYIKSVAINAGETLGVENRAGYYDEAGVLRNMFQNYMMQLLALTAMEAPPRFETEWVRDEKAKVFKALRPFPVGTLA